MTLKIEKPDGWNEDDLSSYLQMAFVNRLATFESEKTLFDQLKRIDRCFLDIADNWLNPSAAVLTSPLLFMRCHASFRASCEHALATQFTDIFPQLRTTLEIAAYALLMEKDPTIADIWIKRHDSEESLKNSRNKFKCSALQEIITKHNRYIGDVFKNLYDTTIDFGAHPNERAISANLRVTKSDRKTNYSHIYMHDEIAFIRAGLSYTTWVGLCSLEILKEVFPDRFEIMGVRSKVLNLRQEIHYPISPSGRSMHD